MADFDELNIDGNLHVYGMNTYKYRSNDPMMLNVNDDFIYLGGTNDNYQCYKLRDDYHSFIIVDPQGSYSEAGKNYFLVVPDPNKLSRGMRMTISLNKYLLTNDNFYLTGYTVNFTTIDKFIISGERYIYPLVQLDPNRAIVELVVHYYPKWDKQRWTIIEGGYLGTSTSGIL